MHTTVPLRLKKAQKYLANFVSRPILHGSFSVTGCGRMKPALAERGGHSLMPSASAKVLGHEGSECWSCSVFIGCIGFRVFRDRTGTSWAGAAGAGVGAAGLAQPPAGSPA